MKVDEGEGGQAILDVHIDLLNAKVTMKQSSIHAIVAVDNRENPVAAVLLSWATVELFLLMGSLNEIAQLRDWRSCSCTLYSDPFATRLINSLAT